MVKCCQVTVWIFVTWKKVYKKSYPCTGNNNRTDKKVGSMRVGPRRYGPGELDPEFWTPGDLDPGVLVPGKLDPFIFGPRRIGPLKNYHAKKNYKCDKASGIETSDFLLNLPNIYIFCVF